MRNPLSRSRPGPRQPRAARVEDPLCAWLSDDVLLLATTAAADLPAEIADSALDFRPTAAAVPAGNATAVYALRVPRSSEDMPGRPTDLATLLRERLALWSPAARGELLAFLASLGVEFGLTPTLAEGLHEAREGLRERLPLSVSAGELEFEARIDAIHRIDDHRFYLRAALREPAEVQAALTIVSPEGESVPLRDRAFVVAAQEEDGVRSVELVCGFETVNPSRRAEGWTLELEAGATGVETSAALAVRGPEGTRRAIASDVLRDLANPDLLMAEHIRPTLSWLQLLAHDRTGIATEHRFGDPPANPYASIVVALGDAIDLIEHQLVAFAEDPELARSELLYVASGPEHREAAEKQARELFALYGLPFRLLVPNTRCSRAVAVELAVDAASGSRLILLAAEVIPSRHGWVGTLADFHDATPAVGAVAPKLLYEDEAIAHAGFDLERHHPSGEWLKRPRFRGLHRDLAAANVASPVPVVGLACAMVGTEALRSVGGLEWLYLGRDFEDSDLCLRLAEAGRENWYLPAVELYFLESGDRTPSTPGERAYDRWLHTRLRGAAATQAAAGTRELSGVA
jgi:hypothetical protein